ncbi:MAG: HEAT repeat domain-containing protein [Elusimicrobiales bacterium]|jgi:hypothetical protein
MLYAAKYRIAAYALALYLIAGAAAAQQAEPRELVSGETTTSVPEIGEMPEMPGMPGEEAGAREDLTPYQAGVQAYLKGKDEEAVSRLREALKLNGSDEKAKRLLLKVMLRAINGGYERGDYKKARALVREARRDFPSNPEVELLYSSMQESGAAGKRKAPAAGPEAAADAQNAEPAPAARRPRRQAIKLQNPEPAPQQRQTAPAAPLRPPAAAQPQEPPVLKQTARAPSPAAGRDNTAYFAAIAAALILSAALVILIYLQQKQEKNLLLRIETLQKALVDGEVRRTEIYKELETWKGLGKQDEELSALRKAKEQRIHLELEKLKAEEEAKILEELAAKRRAAELAADRTREAGTIPPPPPAFAAPAPATTPSAAPPAAAGPEPDNAGAQEKKILEMLVGITPPEREAAWGRIAGRATDLYETSPEAAIKFLYALSRDANPLNRASIIGALAAIGAPATLDILFELYGDADLEVRREAIKQLTRLQKDLTAPLDEDYRKKISACLGEEKTKGDWIF